MVEVSVKEFDLDGSMDDIADLPEFSVFPTGAYVVHYADWEIKDVNGNKTFTSNYVLDEVMEVSENLGTHPETKEQELPPKPGDSMGMMFQVSNETGQGFLKKSVLEPAKIKFGPGHTNREYFEAGKGQKQIIIVKRAWNDQKSRYFAQVRKATFL